MSVMRQIDRQIDKSTSHKKASQWPVLKKKSKPSPVIADT